MGEVNGQVSISPESAYADAAARVRALGHEPGRGRVRRSSPVVLVVRRLADAATKMSVEQAIAADSKARPLEPTGTFAR